jgi:hypothetical protein
MTKKSRNVSPLENGVQVFCNDLEILDSGLFRNDGGKTFTVI